MDTYMQIYTKARGVGVVTDSILHHTTCVYATEEMNSIVCWTDKHRR